MKPNFIPFVIPPTASPGKAELSPQPATAAAAEHAPNVHLQREGERITQIQIRCTCGQLIALDCVE